MPYGNNYEKQNVPGTSNQPLFRLSNKFRSFLSLGMHGLGSSDALIQEGCWVIPKVTCGLHVTASHFTKF